MKLENKAQDEHMQDAFKDLEVLMVRAGEMVGRTSAMLQALKLILCS
jgi:ESCRT-II complex subunit VPS36